MCPRALGQSTRSGAASDRFCFRRPPATRTGSTAHRGLTDEGAVRASRKTSPPLPSIPTPPYQHSDKHVILVGRPVSARPASRTTYETQFARKTLTAVRVLVSRIFITDRLPSPRIRQRWPNPQQRTAIDVGTKLISSYGYLTDPATAAFLPPGHAAVVARIGDASGELL